MNIDEASKKSNWWWAKAKWLNEKPTIIRIWNGIGEVETPDYTEERFDKYELIEPILPP